MTTKQVAGISSLLQSVLDDCDNKVECLWIKMRGKAQGRHPVRGQF